MLSILLAAIISVLVHEAGHALAQVLCGLPVKTIRLGTGPCLLRVGVFELRLVPFSGSVSPLGTIMTKSRSQALLIACGGVLSQWVGVLVLWRFEAAQIESFTFFCKMYYFFSVAGLLELLPIKNRDGYNALVAWRTHKNERIGDLK